MASFRLIVNGTEHHVVADDPEMPLLYALRNDLGLYGPKFGCGLGQCGACTAIVDGAATRTCLLSVAAAEGRSVTTLEGIGTPERLHPVQLAFIDEQAAQCGYCSNGMIMATVALLARSPRPSEAEIRAELAGNLCRCGSYARVLRAVQRAAGGR
jgi:nicotinate dehydrogenase subunit A